MKIDDKRATGMGGPVAAKEIRQYDCLASYEDEACPTEPQQAGAQSGASGGTVTHMGHPIPEKYDCPAA